MSRAPRFACASAKTGAADQLPAHDDLRQRLCVRGVPPLLSEARREPPVVVGIVSSRPPRRISASARPMLSRELGRFPTRGFRLVERTSCERPQRTSADCSIRATEQPRRPSSSDCWNDKSGHADTVSAGYTREHESRCRPRLRQRRAFRQSRASPARPLADRRERRLSRPAFRRRRARALACSATDPRPPIHAARGLLAQLGPAILLANCASAGIVSYGPVCRLAPADG